MKLGTTSFRNEKQMSNMFPDSGRQYAVTKQAN